MKTVYQKPDKFLILTDSFSSIKALKHHNKRKHYILLDIIELLSKTAPGKINVEWVPSQTGISGDEKADSIANMATKLAIIKQSPLSLQEMKRKINATSLNQWRQQ